jgi:hypothetical protein
VPGIEHFRYVADALHGTIRMLVVLHVGGVWPAVAATASCSEVRSLPRLHLEHKMILWCGTLLLLCNICAEH